MTYALPESIGKQQQETLEKKFGYCVYVTNATRYLRICSTCVVNGRGVKNKMRMCGLTGKLTCDECGTESILKIDMLGVMLRLCNINLFMCPTCCQMCIWKGTGYDLSICTCKPLLRIEKKTSCSVCTSRYVVMGPLLYTDTERKRIAQVYLCGKHVIPKHILPFIHSYKAFQATIRRQSVKKKIS
jgi:hypothetical protein